MKSIAFGCVLAVSAVVCAESADRLMLADQGKTKYQIVIAGNSVKNIWDGQFLAWFLKEKTGADFPVVGAMSYDAKKPAIFVGASRALRAAIDSQPFRGMKDQDHVVKSKGRDIALYGKGFDADFYAIVEFLDRCLGFRIYQKWEIPEIVKMPTLELEPFDWKLGWALTYRSQTHYNFTDYFRGASDYGERKSSDAYGFFPHRLKEFSFMGDYREIQPPRRILLHDNHTALRLIPSATRAGYEAYPFVGTNDYFTAHPEYFYMNRKGKRTDEYLCWSNPGMRRQMKANIEKLFDSVGSDEGVFAIGMADGVDACHCPDCTALAEKYGTPGAAYFEFLCEIGNEFLVSHPHAVIRGSFYQEGQTQIPPKFEPGRKFPRNIELEYCDILSKTNKRWDEHPDNRRAYEMLKQAAKLTGEISVMTYYPHYGVSALFPFCSTGVIVDNLRKLHELGLRGNFFEFYPFNNGFSSGADDIHYLNFADLNLYLFYRFSKYPDLDFDAEVLDFCRHVYGPAAEMVKAYHDELLRLSTTENPHVIVLSGDNFNKEFSYLNAENLCRWEKAFDGMTELVKDAKPLFRKNLADLRRTLDLTVYGRWKECVGRHPDYFRDPEFYRTRIGTPKHPVWAKAARDFLDISALNIKYLGKEKPLPRQFAGIAESRIKRVVPTNHANCPQMSKIPKIVPDDDAAFGYAASVDTPGLPFGFGCYDFVGKRNQGSLELKAGDIVPCEFRLYHVGIVRPTERCLVWFGRSWSTNYDLSKVLDLADVQAKYDCWVSLKFPKDFKGGRDELVLCDQIILVRE